MALLCFDALVALLCLDELEALVVTLLNELLALLILVALLLSLSSEDKSSPKSCCFCYSACRGGGKNGLANILLITLTVVIWANLPSLLYYFLRRVIDFTLPPNVCLLRYFQ